MHPTPDVWGALVQGEGDGAVVGAPTRLHFPLGMPHDVDALKDAAKAKFVQRLMHVDAADLAVSATRDGPRIERQSTLVVELGAGTSEEEPLYIHAPAPPQAQGDIMDDFLLLCFYWLRSTFSQSISPTTLPSKEQCVHTACSTHAGPSPQFKTSSGPSPKFKASSVPSPLHTSLSGVSSMPGWNDTGDWEGVRKRNR